MEHIWYKTTHCCLEAGAVCFTIALISGISCPPTRIVLTLSGGIFSEDEVDDDVSDDSGSLSEYTDVILEYRLRLRVDL